jgi:hypothetical protein
MLVVVVVAVKRASMRLSSIVAATHGLVKFYYLDLTCASESTMSEISKAKFLAFWLSCGKVGPTQVIIGFHEKLYLKS